MVLSGVRKTTDAIITVSKDLNPQLVILLQDEARAREGKSLKEVLKKRHILDRIR